MRPEPTTKGVLELDKQRNVVETRPNPETLVFLSINTKVAVSVAGSFWFRDCGRFKITISDARGTI